MSILSSGADPLSPRFPGCFILFLPVIFLLMGQNIHAQSSPRPEILYNYWPDSLRRELSQATTPQEKARWCILLANYYYGQDSLQSEAYGRQAVETAEMSRDRMLMIRTYIGNGERYLQNGGLAGKTPLAMENFHRAEDIAREEKLDAGLVYSDCALANVCRLQGDDDRSVGYSNQAVVLAEEVEDDSLKVLAYTSLGNSYTARNEKLSAFRNYLKALDVAEQSKRDRSLFQYFQLVFEQPAVCQGNGLSESASSCPR